MPTEIIAVPKPDVTDYGKTNICTEIAFSRLIEEAHKLGLPINPTMGLMYLPDQRVTVQFQAACRAVLACLTPEPVAT